MIYPNSLKTALLAVVLAGISAVWGPGVSAQTPHTACSAGGVTCLDQGWDDTQRSWWYSTSQGSRLLPLSWALSLKTEDGRDAMFGPANLSRLGYLSNPVSRDNPHGLPVGFVVDEDRGRGADLMCDTFPETCLSRTMRTPWIGLNCAACHTAEIAYAGTVMRIDGAPANADFDSLVSGTEAALRATRDAPDRWAQFARAVLGSDDADAILSLRTQVDEQIDWMARLSAFNASHVIAGPARLDAQGHILAKVAAINGAPDAVPVIRSDAPASYPFIWNTHQQEKLQWNGIADAVQTIRILGHDTGVGALIRNTSEVIGVFAHVEADRGWAALGYDSSVRVTAMVNLERQLARLNSPLWPEALLGPIDTDLAAQGAEIFDRSCASCHAPLGHGDLTTP
ncbi:di-heme-cytochrome C peroxidase, partial [Loktanella sp. M215]|uniref:di-heme-cytochrome C peroxidase n=1 Tax=Loktanella sp. M215 TaxID=2675431 RepID=UPI001F344A57